MSSSIKGIICPSAPGESGDVAIGSVNVQGSIDFWHMELEVDRDFLQALVDNPRPPTFRYATRCISQDCRNWADGACRLPAKLEPSNSVPEFCVVRANCRWYRQEGEAACGKCNRVLYEGLIDQP